MRVHQITCPHCGSGMKSKAGIPAGQTIPCPKCKKKFAVEAVEEADVLDDDEVIEDFDVEEPAPRPAKKGPPAGAKKSSARDDDDDDDDDDEPRPKKKSAGAKGKNVRPRDDDDDEDDRPKKKKKKKRKDDEEEGIYTQLKNNILVRILTLAILLGILGVVGYLFYEKQQAANRDNATPAPTKKNQDEDVARPLPRFAHLADPRA